MRLSRDPAARQRLALLGALAAAALVLGLVVGASGDAERGAGGERPASERAAAGEAVDRLTLRRQVGQLVLSSFDGGSPPPYLLRRLGAGETAGVILFGRNAASPAALRALTRSLQRAAGGSSLVAVDQEGGSVRTVRWAGPAASQASQGPPAAVERGTAEAARELRAVGVNVSLAPVADFARPGGALAGRAFLGTPAEVAARVRAAVRGLGRGGVGATPKHFPGLGAATRNTDDAPVEIPLERTALVPFRAAVAERAALVMASHVLVPALDGERIASQSPPLLRGLLRRQLGFGGVVVTDSMEAQAVLARSDLATAAERSIAAGADLLLLTGSASWKLAYPRLLDRARRDPAFRRRVRASAARVLALKRRLGLRAPR